MSEAVVVAEAIQEPTEAPKRRKRDRTVQVRCYAEEAGFLDDMAREEGVSVADLCRAIWHVASHDLRFREAIRTRLAGVFK